jgi:hypothetical protein
MQLSIYLYWVRFHPTYFGPPIGPSSGVSRAANSCRQLVHAVMCIRVSADSGLVVFVIFNCLSQLAQPRSCRNNSISNKCLICREKLIVDVRSKHALLLISDEEVGYKKILKCSDAAPFVYTGFVCFWRDNPPWARASLFTISLDHKQRRTTVLRTPLDEWSTRRRNLYLTIQT